VGRIWKAYVIVQEHHGELYFTPCKGDVLFFARQLNSGTWV